MILLALAAAAATVDPSALGAVQACRAQAAASGKACDSQWRGIRLRLDATLHGSVRATDGTRRAAWVTDCPYDVVHRSGGCAFVTRGVMLLQPYDRDVPAFVWGDRNAERRERLITLDDGRRAGWTEAMSPAETRTLLDLLAQSRYATFAWRAARAKTLSATRVDLAGFGDLTLLLSAMRRVAQEAHAAG